jgi:hypothetical protein
MVRVFFTFLASLKFINFNHFQLPLQMAKKKSKVQKMIQAVLCGNIDIPTIQRVTQQQIQEDQQPPNAYEAQRVPVSKPPETFIFHGALRNDGPALFAESGDLPRSEMVGRHEV